MSTICTHGVCYARPAASKKRYSRCRRHFFAQFLARESNRNFLGDQIITRDNALFLFFNIISQEAARHTLNAIVYHCAASIDSENLGPEKSNIFWGHVSDFPEFLGYTFLFFWFHFFSNISKTLLSNLLWGIFLVYSSLSIFVKYTNLKYTKLKF